MRADLTTGGLFAPGAGLEEAGDGEPEDEGDSCEQPARSQAVKTTAEAPADATAGRARRRALPFLNNLTVTVAILEQRPRDCQSYDSRALVQEM